MAGRLSDQAIYNIVKKRQDEAGIAEISPHDFRKRLSLPSWRKPVI